MKDKRGVMLILNRFENDILEVIEDQLSAYNTDGVDRSYTQSDLQGRIGAIVRNIWQESRRTK